MLEEEEQMLAQVEGVAQVEGAVEEMVVEEGEAVEVEDVEEGDVAEAAEVVAVVVDSVNYVLN